MAFIADFRFSKFLKKVVLEPYCVQWAATIGQNRQILAVVEPTVSSWSTSLWVGLTCSLDIFISEEHAEDIFVPWKDISCTFNVTFKFICTWHLWNEDKTVSYHIKYSIVLVSRILNLWMLRCNVGILLSYNNICIAVD